MDCSMPIMDGYQATRQIRDIIDATSLEQPIIVACTGHVENEYIQQAWNHRMDEVVPKPAQAAVIQEIINEYITLE